jgi:ABC-2 type transport system ATP-binding protein
VPRADDEVAVGAAPAVPGMDVVAVDGLTKRFGDVVAVDDVSFRLAPGTITGFLGPNGAGKSTTLRLLLGLAAPSAGRAHVFGHRYAELDQPSRHVGAMLESSDFHPGRRGRDHLLGLALAAGLPSETYSLGMRQRLGLAGALLGDPGLLVLDEPANGLDPAGISWLRTFLRAFAAGGGTVLTSSHGLAEVTQTVDHVLVLSRGRLVADSALDELVGAGRTLEDAYLALTQGASR